MDYVELDRLVRKAVREELAHYFKRTKSLGEHRRAKGMRPRDLAKAAGVNVQTIYDIENGLRENTRLLTKRKIAKALGAKVEDVDWRRG